jgi:hypothetical protein
VKGGASDDKSPFVLYDAPAYARAFAYVGNGSDKGRKMSEYNYVHFDMAAERPNFDRFSSELHVGERAPDFPLEDLDTGETVNLKDVWSTGLVVAEFGSFT